MILFVVVSWLNCPGPVPVRWIDNRRGLEGASGRFLYKLEASFASAGYDPGTAMKELLRARREELQRAAEEKERSLRAERMAALEREKEEAREEARRAHATLDRIQAAIIEARDFEGLLALVREETISPSGPQKLRFSVANSVKWFYR